MGKTIVKYYAVAAGSKPAVYTDWDEAKKQVEGISNNCHKSFLTRQEAEQFIIDYNNAASCLNQRDSRAPLGSISGNSTPAATSPNRKPSTDPTQEEISVRSFAENDTEGDTRGVSEAIPRKRRRQKKKKYGWLKKTSNPAEELTLSLEGLNLKVDIGEKRTSAATKAEAQG